MTFEVIARHYETRLEEFAIALEQMTKRLTLLESNQHALLNEEETAVLRNYFNTEIRALTVKNHRASKWLNAPVDPIEMDDALNEKMTERLADLLLGEKLPLNILDGEFVLIPAYKKISKNRLRLMAYAWRRGTLYIEPSPIRRRVWLDLSKFQEI